MSNRERAAPDKDGSSNSNGTHAQGTAGKNTRSPKGKRVTQRQRTSTEVWREARQVLPVRVVKAYKLGLWILPQLARPRKDVGFSKVPPFRWKQYQEKRPKLRQLIEWQKRYNPPMWAFLAGRVLFALDFDPADNDGDPDGLETLAKLGLRPYTLSSGGGRHVYVRMPDHAVATQTRGSESSAFPGMEVKAAGNSLITFYGSNPDGEYQPANESRLYTFGELPADLQRYVQHPEQKRQRRKPAVELGERPLPAAMQLALARLGGRDLHQKDDRQWEACCPVHNEDRPSFGIGLGADRLIVANCFACGASVEDIADALGIDPTEFSRRPWDSAWKDEPAYLLGSDTPLEKVRWLWRYIAPIGKPTIFEGDPGKGKSVVTMDIAARVTTGRPMPDGPDGLDGPYAVLIISGEDDYADTIKPRLLAAGVDETRVVRLTLERDESGKVIPLTLPTGLNRIRAALEQAHRDHGLVVKLIVIDPITNFLAERTQTGVDSSVRTALTPLSELASELDVALILVRHLNKQGDMKAIYRGGGSIAFVALSRSAYVFDRHPEKPDLVVMAPVKANLVPRHLQKSRTYELEENEAYEVPQVKWGAELLDLDADTLLKGMDSRKNAPETQRAASLMRELLEDGPRPEPDMESGASWPSSASMPGRRQRRSWA